MTPARRIEAVDVARGLALATMVVYHLSWDLSWFRLVDWPVDQHLAWRAFAAAIAGSFLFLAGVSLVLAHGDGVRWKAFWRREAVIVAAAAAVSLGTWAALGPALVRFGILHCIAAASLIALPFVRLPAVAALAAGAVVLSLPLWAGGPAFDGPWLLWTGLGHPGVSSVDHVPLAPWAGAALLGVGAARLGRSQLERLRAWRPAGVGPATLTRAGRHSLAVYLLHQPVLFGALWAASAAGLTPDRASAEFVDTCSFTCILAGGEEAACRRTCRCTFEALGSDGLWQRLLDDPEDPDLREEMNRRYAACSLTPDR
ncbi:heparan-alpha-glucosaminide N-acetyltransferase [Polymorphum gilvum]|uniref:Heparan-alpha-glucosaminide N-acetyltransferase catalytic domain-containing protein n=1 Tax=Polymorphum gilvum (strain LMG 25793 / CGMCC 1.9160 / SL003B-26A1) TaxID=991905 RepID=F2J0K4_POLGS|nr:heparan-alpha-glucosaminide N-acetyltransferase [Polymorphum gilvum]ADZ69672.1 hypothetical protein SL003B_1243 [Polymorphum gilvum SL003B-26A1]